MLLRVQRDDGPVLEAMRAGPLQQASHLAELLHIGRVDEVRQDGTRVCHVRYEYSLESATEQPHDCGDFARQPHAILQDRLIWPATPAVMATATTC